MATPPNQEADPRAEDRKGQLAETGEAEMRENTSVWLVFDGVSYEGEEFHGAYASEDAARRKAEEVARGYTYRPLREDTWNEWSNGSAWVRVMEVEVQE